MGSAPCAGRLSPTTGRDDIAHEDDGMTDTLANRRVFRSKVDTIRPTYGFEDVSLAPGTDTADPADVVRLGVVENDPNRVVRPVRVDETAAVVVDPRCRDDLFAEGRRSRHHVKRLRGRAVGEERE